MSFKATFQAIYDATKEGIKAAKAPLVKQRNMRACDSAIDSAEDIIIDTEEELSKLMNVINEGQVIDHNKVLACYQKIDDAKATAERLRQFKAEFYA